MSTQNKSQNINFPLVSLVSNTFLPFSPESAQKEAFRSSLINAVEYQHNLNLKYFEQFKKLYFTAYCISLQFTKLDNAHQDLINRIHKSENTLSEDLKPQISSLNLDREKRQRRKAEQIQRKFVCQAERCGRSYGTEGSLQQHLKLKHPSLFKSNHRFGDQSL